LAPEDLQEETGPEQESLPEIGPVEDEE
jgi:hypothetical protein